MAGASTTLSLQDRLSGPLTKMMRAMDRTIAIMEQMDNAAGNIDTRGLQRARRDIQSATADLERLRSSSSETDRLSDGFRRMQGPVNSAGSAIRDFFASFAGAAAAYLSIQGIANGFKKFVGASDTFVSTAARLGNINDGLQTQVELQDKIYNAAQRSRGAYVDMADSVAKLNLLAGDAFSGNDEAIRFSELMGKSFTISGAGVSEKQAGMHQLTQAMASGRLQGDEFVSITENAPLLAKAIADSMDASMGELKKLSSEGKITADIIKSALFKASDEIEAKFKEMPLTFGQAMTAVKNWALFAFEPLLKRFNDFVNSDAFAVLAGHVMFFVNVFIAGMTFLFDVLETIYTEFGAIGQMLTDSWAVVGPVIIVAASALGTYLAIMLAYRGVLIVTAAIEGARAFALSVTAAAAMFAAGATFAMTVAQHGLNAAILAFPGTWILIAFVAVIVLVIYAFIAWGDTMAIIFGAIVGGIYWLGAAFTNVMLGIGNFGIMVAEWFVNTWNQSLFLVQLALIALNLGARVVMDAIGNTALKTAEWFANTWNDASYAVQMGFHKMLMFVTSIMGGVANGVVGTVNTALGAISDLINGAVKGVNSFIGLLNNVLGTDLSTVGTVDLKLSSAATNFTDKLQANLHAPTKAEKANFGRMDTAGDYAKNIEMPSAPSKTSFDRLEYTSLGDVYDRGNQAGAELSNKVSAGLNSVVDKVSGFLKGPDSKGNPLVPGNIPAGDLAGMGNPLGGGNDKLAKDKKGKNPTGGKLDKVGKIEKDINIADEDLKMLRDLAEIKSIQNIVTLTPSVQFGDMTVREEADVNKILKKIETYLEGELVNNIEGAILT